MTLVVDGFLEGSFWPLDFLSGHMLENFSFPGAKAKSKVGRVRTVVL